MFTLENMFELVNLGYLNFQKHPTLDLYIFNYSKKAQYEKYWTEVTLACRGLVINSNDRIVARCLPKFFNYQELEASVLPNSTFQVYEKLDGSYLQIFRYKSELIFSTRGSFTSDQAIKARDIFFKKYAHLSEKMLDKHNYIFEVIYPNNRIVVDYGNEEDIVMLTVIHAETGEDKIHDIGFPIVKTYDGFKDFEEILNIHLDNQEGFVIKYDTPDNIAPFRFKSKIKEYVRLHRILTNISSRDVWRHLKDYHNLDEILEKVPDEFYDWVKDVEDRLYKNYYEILAYCTVKFKPLQTLIFLRNLPQIDESMKDSIINKKQAAAYIMKNVMKRYQGIVFNMYYGQDYKKAIWEMIEPEWEKPFNSKFHLENEDE
jgi:RNA ligase